MAQYNLGLLTKAKEGVEKLTSQIYQTDLVLAK